MNRKAIILTLLFSFFSLIVTNISIASPIADQHAFIAVQQQLAQAKSLHGKFTQKRVIKVLSKPLLSSGHFSLSQKQGLKWIQEKPFPSTLTLSSSRLTQRIGNNPPMVLTKAKQPIVFSFSKIFLSVFKGDKTGLNQSFKIAFTGTPQHWNMTLTPKSSPLNKAVKSIKLSGGKIIKQIIVDNVKHDQLIIKFSDVKVTS